MNTINSWKSIRKQNDKYELTIRIKKLTLLEINLDFSSKKFRYVIFNFGLEF